MEKNIDPTMLLIYTTKSGQQRDKMVPQSKLHAEVSKLAARGCWSIKVL
jgi:hypothetical protein